MKGISFSIAIGQWAKPHIRVGEYTARLCLGFIAFTFWTLDLEDFMMYLSKAERASKHTKVEAKTKPTESKPRVTKIEGEL